MQPPVEPFETEENFRRYRDPRAPSGTLFGLQADQLKTYGALFLGIGFFLFILGPILFITAPMPDLFTVGFDETTRQMNALMARTIIVTMVGFVLVAIGGFLFRFGMVRPVTGYVATEAGPAISSVAESIERGLASSGGIPVRITGGTGPATIVRVKCRNCGYLESEDATYCSKCGKPV